MTGLDDLPPAEDKDDDEKTSKNTANVSSNKRLKIWNPRTGLDESPETPKPIEEYFRSNGQTDGGSPDADVAITRGAVLSEGTIDCIFVWDKHSWENYNIKLPRRGRQHNYYLTKGIANNGEKGLLLTANKKVDGKIEKIYGGWVRKQEFSYYALKDMVSAGVHIVCVVHWHRKFYWERKGFYCWDGAMFWKAYISEDDNLSTDDFHSDGDGTSELGSDEEN
ncbi:hypothetical protein BJ508DRAFT_328875 [Ascobolus immersus RN42]|uniref:Uncharacterized protein n=1 Tax=Ascobolus immersus RN42 TaxID=1160509 RepID=A0A3N4HYB1_ASCIM|nr:hypothetical protein BJ508DRAFT_328875 [Ascobolus immersus RN42]